MGKNIKLWKKLTTFRLPPHIKTLKNLLKKQGFLLKIISQNGNFSKYIDYVLKNKKSLKPESEYVVNNLLKGDSWGEILIIENKAKIVASFGPNRVEKENPPALKIYLASGMKQE